MRFTENSCCSSLESDSDQSAAPVTTATPSCVTSPYGGSLKNNRTFGDYIYTEEELDQMYGEATQRGCEALAKAPRAATAHYDKKTDHLVIELINGTLVAIPRKHIQGLREASPADVAEVELAPFGLGLHWETLDEDFTVAGLVSGILGTQAWMAELGRRGGAATSDAKAAAARANGKKGGRPNKAQTHTAGR
jgi:Protein of unknown function (DUF2442)